MTTWYVDYVNGTDANASVGAGDSFSTRRKKIDNMVSTALAAGDTIRVMGSPAPTSMAQLGVWTNGPQPAVVSIVSSTNASPISIQATSHGLVTGDTVFIQAHSVNTNANGTFEVTVTDANNFTLNGSTGNGVGGATGNIRKWTSMRVQLASAVTKNIALVADNQNGKPNWTASANVTCAIQVGAGKQGYDCEQFAVAAGFTTGLAAFFATGLLDLSAYKQVSFWIKQTAGTILAAGQAHLALCSDTAGVTAVHTIPIPALGVTGGNTGLWIPITWDNGAFLSNSIQSIALYIDVDNGAQTFQLDNVIACKDSASADSLTLTSFIGKNKAGETFWPIQSISGTRVVVDQLSDNSGISSTRGYIGTTETVTTYKRETIKTVLAANSANVQVVQQSGISGSPITISGGWNQTDMSTQTLDTWFDGTTCQGRGFEYNGKSFVNLDLLNFVRYDVGISSQTGGADNGLGTSVHTHSNGSGGILVSAAAAARYTITDAYAIGNGNASGGILLSGGGMHIVSGTLRAYSNVGQGAVCAQSCIVNAVDVQNNNSNGFVATSGCVVSSATAKGNSNTGLFANGYKCTIKNFTSQNNQYGISGQSSGGDGGHFWNGSTSGNSSAGLNPNGGVVFLRDVTLGDTTPIQAISALTLANARVYSENDGGVAGNHVITAYGGKIVTTTAVRHTASGIAWNFQPTSTDRTANFPLDLSVAKIAVASGTLVTVSMWVQRDNTGLTMRLRVPGGQLSGVPSDVTAVSAGVINTWEQLTVTFTPTEAGVIEVFADAYGGTTFNGYIDDLSVSQA